MVSSWEYEELVFELLAISKYILKGHKEQWQNTINYPAPSIITAKHASWKNEWMNEYSFEYLRKWL